VVSWDIGLALTLLPHCPARLEKPLALPVQRTLDGTRCLLEPLEGEVRFKGDRYDGSGGGEGRGARVKWNPEVNLSHSGDSVAGANPTRPNNASIQAHTIRCH
jgi:hypothetical protein